MTLLILAAMACTTPDDTATDDTSSSVSCDNNICFVSGQILADTTWTADNEYLLQGGVEVGDGVDPVVLTIEPGTTIYGENSSGGMLVVHRNSKLMAEGTADAPIVFTSSLEDGSRARGDWGGIILNGNAPLNVCDGVADAPDPCEANGEGGTGTFGGNDPADNSGVLTYVRVEFAGSLISPENELNGIAFQGVGSGTTLDYIQVHRNDDDGVEFYGGTADISHLVVSGVGDDGLDWTDGWQGSAQYVVIHTYGDGDQGIEADNNGENNDAEPRSNPSISNVTIVGIPNEGEGKPDLGILVREGTAGSFESVLVQGFMDGCMGLNHDATYEQASSGALSFSDMVFACDVAMDDETGFETYSDVTAADMQDALESDGLQIVTGPLVANGGSQDAPDFMPASGFESIGAIVDGTDWTAGWTSYPAN
jgi:hypothetical protein